MDDMNEVLALQELSRDGEEANEAEIGGGGSRASLLLCQDTDSSLSITLCD